MEQYLEAAPVATLGLLASSGYLRAADLGLVEPAEAALPIVQV